MTRFTREIQKWIVPTLVGTILLITSCKKDKVPSPTPTPEPAKWEKIAGTYKVYDTLGVYLYEMELTPIFDGNNEIDSLRFENFGGEFEFTTKQLNPSPSNMPMCISIGGHDEIMDNQMNRWDLTGALYEDYNVYQNDTIKLFFQKTNINYYIEDLTPYYARNCKQIAVKQK